MVLVEKKDFFSAATIVSAESWLVQLFGVVLSLLHPGNSGELGEVSVVQRDQFDWYFADKINGIWTDLDSGFQLQSRNTLSTLTSRILWDAFQLITSEEMDRFS